MNKINKILLIGGVAIFGCSMIITTSIIAERLKNCNLGESSYVSINLMYVNGEYSDGTSGNYSSIPMHWGKGRQIKLSNELISSIDDCYYYSYYEGSANYYAEFEYRRVPSAESYEHNFTIEHTGHYYSLKQSLSGYGPDGRDVDFLLVW